MSLMEHSLAELVCERPGATAIFHRHRLDFCCGGQQSLASALAARGLAPEAIVAELEALPFGHDHDVDWRQADNATLIDHLLTRFHAVHREQLPELIRLARRAETLMENGGSILTMSYYGAEKAIEHYNLMGPVKAALESSVRYLARDLGLKELYLWPINADQQGTPQQVRKVIDLVKKHRIPAVFSESTVSDKPARQVARETDTHYGGVLYVDSLSAENGPVPTYIDLLNVTTRTLVQGIRDGMKE